MKKPYTVLSTAAFIFTLNSTGTTLSASSKRHIFPNQELEKIANSHNDPNRLKELSTINLIVSDERVSFENDNVGLIPKKAFSVKTRIKTVSRAIPKIYGSEEI